VSGPQQAIIAFEVDPKHGNGTLLEGKLQISANGGQTLTVKVSADVRGAPRVRRDAVRAGEPVRTGPPAPALHVPGVQLPSGGFLRPVLALALAFFLLRLALLPLVDLGGRAIAVTAAAAKAGLAPADDRSPVRLGDWLQL